MPEVLSRQHDISCAFDESRERILPGQPDRDVLDDTRSAQGAWEGLQIARVRITLR